MHIHEVALNWFMVLVLALGPMGVRTWASHSLPEFQTRKPELYSVIGRFSGSRRKQFSSCTVSLSTGHQGASGVAKCMQNTQQHQEPVLTCKLSTRQGALRHDWSVCTISAVSCLQPELPGWAAARKRRTEVGITNQMPGSRESKWEGSAKRNSAPGCLLTISWWEGKPQAAPFLAVCK